MLTGQLCRLHVFKVRTMTQTEPIESSAEPARVSTGNFGLDDILGGGLDPERVYLIEGRPGTGKTTLALQFLLEGVRRGERCLYVTLSESESELRSVVGRHGWTLDGIDIFELVPPEASLDPDQELTLFHPAEMELSETTKHILDRVIAVNPSRVVFELALRDAVVGAKLVALSPPNPCLEELLCSSAMHRRLARRSHVAAR